MGYIRHHAIVVTAYDDDEIKQAHDRATELFEHLVTPIVKSGMNGYASFFVAPDGSKEGWERSNEYDLKRAELVAFVEGLGLNFAELYYGDDNGDCRILKPQLVAK